MVIAAGSRMLSGGCTSFVLDPACRQAGFCFFFINKKDDKNILLLQIGISYFLATDWHGLGYAFPLRTLRTLREIVFIAADWSLTNSIAFINVVALFFIMVTIF